MGTAAPDYSEATPQNEPLVELLDGVQVSTPDAHPVPVYAVEPIHVIDQPARTFSTSQRSVPVGPAVRIANSHPARCDVLIANIGTVTIWIGATEAEASDSSGFPLLPGAGTNIAARSDVWARAYVDPGSVATLSQSQDG